MMKLKMLRNASQLLLQNRIEQVEAGDRRECVFIDDVDTARTRSPAQLGVEHDKTDHSEPEDRDGIADEADDANDLVDDAAAFDRRENA